METRLAATLFLGLVVVVSGCADNNGTPGTDVGSSSGKGLEIVSLEAVDDQITPGQSTRISLRLKNYHTEDIEITDLWIFNEGELEVEKQGCSPSEIGTARQGIAPEMSCNWRVTAPSEEELGAFDSKPMPVNLRIAYESSLVNSEPLEVEFKPLSEIETADTRTKTYSNGEVEATMELETPASLEGRNIYFTVRNAGPGSVEEGYSFSYSPAVFNCPSRKEPVIGDEVEFSCTVQDSQETIRYLSTSISYKYVKTPTLDIEVVNR